MATNSTWKGIIEEDSIFKNIRHFRNIWQPYNMWNFLKHSKLISYISVDWFRQRALHTVINCRGKLRIKSCHFFCLSYNIKSPDIQATSLSVRVPLIILLCIHFLLLKITYLECWTCHQMWLSSRLRRDPWHCIEYLSVHCAPGHSCSSDGRGDPFSLSEIKMMPQV